MRSPALSELPPPPAGKTGWPWTQEIEQLPERMSDDKAWPKVSIVTPSYNQGQFIEETIRSVLLQGYPNLEYIIIDGGSTDGSPDVIHKYEAWLAYWVSEPDGGPYYALKKGFAQATGDIVAWQNADDYYEPAVFGRAAQAFGDHHDIDVVYGNVRIVNEQGDQVDELRFVPATYWSTLFEGHTMHNQAAFFHGRLWHRIGGFVILDDPSSDYDLFIRATREAQRLKFVHRTWGNYRKHPGSITFGGQTEHTDPWEFRRHHLGWMGRLPNWVFTPLAWLSLGRRAAWYGMLGDWDYLLAGVRRRILSDRQ